MSKSEMTKRIDIMVDIETLGNKTDSTVFQISAMAFDLKTGQILNTFNEIADIEKNERPINVTGSTIKWWLKTNKELFEQLLNSGTEPSEIIVWHFYLWLNQFSANYGKENVYLWGNGILFDNAIIQHQMKMIEMDYPIFYRNDRDVRTILELASAKTGLSEKEIKNKFTDSSLVAHDAYNDVKNQIDLVVGCYNMIVGKEG